MATLTRDQLLAKRADTATGHPEEVVEVPALGGSVTVRSLSRFEVLLIGKMASGAVEIEQHYLHFGLLDPVLSLEDAKRWQKLASPAEVRVVSDAIMRLSGIMPGNGAVNAAYEEFEDDPAAEFRVLPGAEDGPDGSGAADGSTGADQ